MATVAESLFGVTPESLQRQRQQQLRQEAMDYASIADPFQQANFAIYQGAGNLARGIGGLLGAQDPELMRVRQRQELLQGINPADPASLRSAAQRAMEANDFQAAQMLADRALAAETAQAKLASENALTNQRNRERAAADPFQQLVKSGMYTPESLAAYQQSGLVTDLVRYEKPEKPTSVSFGAEAERVSRELYNKPFSALTQPEIAAVNKRVDEAAKKGTTVNVSVAGQTEFSKKLGELDAKRVADALTARDNAIATVRSLDQLASLDDQGLISGTFATGRVGATNLLNTLGLASPADQARLASSQNYQKVAGDVILGILGGKLGAGFSNDDRKFIEGLVPQLETSPAARRQLINFMRSKNMAIADEATRLENYARDKNGLKGFTPKFPMGANVPATSLSVDDLAKAAGGKIVNGKFVPNK